MLFRSALAQLFLRLKHIEAYGTGLRRIFDLYGTCSEQPSITVTENSFRLTLPNMNVACEHADGVSESRGGYITDQMKMVLDYLDQRGEADEEALMALLNVKRTRTYLITKEMVDMGLLTIIGRGKEKIFVRSMPQCGDSFVVDRTGQ